MRARALAIEPSLTTPDTADSQRYAALQQIAVELMTTIPPDELLDKIVHRAVDLVGCDGASLYGVRDEKDLIFEVVINRSTTFDFEFRRLPIEGNGIARYVFHTCKPVNVPDAYKIPSSSPYTFDPSFDNAAGYRTRSVLAVPLVTTKGETVGVLQLINRKTNPDQVWPSDRPKELAAMPPFSPEDERLVASFAGLAAAAIDNARLNKTIEELFEGFVLAAIGLAERKKPEARQHAERVAALSCELARAISHCDEPDVRLLHFTERDIQELRYAALLHELGKHLDPGTQDPKAQIQSTVDFLRPVPWGRRFPRLPEVIHCHLERMDGSGMPRHLKGEKIPNQARILAICDSFDELAAQGAESAALTGLEKMAQAGKLDPRFVRIFLSAQVHKNATTDSVE